MKLKEKLAYKYADTNPKEEQGTSILSFLAGFEAARGHIASRIWLDSDQDHFAESTYNALIFIGEEEV